MTCGNRQPAEFALTAGHDDIVELIQTWAAVEEGGGRDWVRGCIYNRTHEERERARVVEEKARKARLKSKARAGWKRAKEGAELASIMASFKGFGAKDSTVQKQIRSDFENKQRYG